MKSIQAAEKDLILAKENLARLSTEIIVAKSKVKAAEQELRTAIGNHRSRQLDQKAERAAQMKRDGFSAQEIGWKLNMTPTGVNAMLKRHQGNH